MDDPSNRATFHEELTVSSTILAERFTFTDYTTDPKEQQAVLHFA